MNEFDWIKEEVNVSRITHWTEHHLREYLKYNTMTIDVYDNRYDEPIHYGKHKLYQGGKKRYTLERKVKRTDYHNGWRTYDSIDKRHYRIEQVVRFLNRKEWVII